MLKGTVTFSELCDHYGRVSRSGEIVYCYINNLEVHVYKKTGLNAFFFQYSERLAI